MSASKLKYLLLGSMAAGALMTASPASALTIELNDIGGVSGSPAALGFQVAAKYWESVFTNDAVVRFDVGFSALDPGILGQTGSTLATYVDIADYKAALAFTGTSALDAVATANFAPLNGNGGVQALVPGYLNPATQDGINPLTTRLAPDGNISETIALSTANLKALAGDIGYAGPDGEITFSSNFNFDFDPRDGVTAGYYDFIAVAVHEIGHALGFLSGADDFDYSAGPGPVDQFWWGYGLDMFRYSASGENDAPILDWRPGADSYFSVDGGQTALGYFSTGENFGDGYQASHWKAPQTAPFCSGLLGIMNPYACGGSANNSVTGLDLALFDAIGWNVNVDVLNNPYNFSTSQMAEAYLPEPSTWAMLIMGMGATGAILRRRRMALALAR
ncbi:MAG: NF038122 family metalloprotease [Alphaproteobacteria bacterium]|nr:NF038122 family metalloprotease [Alphaproteobacteria bacterium]MBU1516816.1 NF038122 family metalloprotease [Alphaproteobacteria bacterium]MBU2092510.1 NF038122 family metalloprotease [Alphaproteobacteria bacterium]MBU2152359.1 NF038122 family metalloprotease [Alphaproteobacteria bacterium]MBU2305570.1 NF038122 family metalloprotease [Alphaproteobacteria bacterium]